MSTLSRRPGTASRTGSFCAAVRRSSLVTALTLHRRESEARAAEQATTARAHLVRLAAGEDDGSARDALHRLSADDWRPLEPQVLTLLAQLRGRSAEALVTLLERHGTVERARCAATSAGPEGRAHAARVLGLAGRGDVLPDLLRLVDDRDDTVRESAARACGHLGDPGAAASLLRSARRAGGRPLVPHDILRSALRRLDLGIVDELRSALSDPDPSVRALAAEVAADRGTAPLRLQLAALLAVERDTHVIDAVETALDRLGPLRAPHDALRWQPDLAASA